tara:strand:- start:8992 stop:9159 length:168 start_codon:yes stop_codon:yes gene_type:complete
MQKLIIICTWPIRILFWPVKYISRSYFSESTNLNKNRESKKYHFNDAGLDGGDLG